MLAWSSVPGILGSLLQAPLLGSPEGGGTALLPSFGEEEMIEPQALPLEGAACVVGTPGL